MKASVLFFFGMAALFTACDKESPVQPPPRGPYVLDTTLAVFPLKPGVSLSTELYTLSESGTITLTRRYGPYTMSAYNVVEGREWFTNPGWGSHTWNGPGGIWMKTYLNLPDTSRNLIWKWPCAKGDTFSTRLYGLPVLVTVEAVDEVITVPAAQETCVVYTYRYRQPSGNYEKYVVNYLAPGLGWLREDYYTTGDPPTSFATSLLPLTSYVKYRWVATSISIP